MVNKAVDAGLPKTRFDSRDKCRELRSCSSPRLKSFPAEKINKLNNSPSFSPDSIAGVIVQENPREAGKLLMASTDQPARNDNGGQGDAVAATQNFHQQRRQNINATGYQLGVSEQIHPRSECTLPQQALNYQPHRPFAPFTPREHSPRKETTSNRVSVPAMPQLSTQEIPNDSAATIDQGKIKTKEHVNVTESPDYQKQPVGGRNAAFHRQMIAPKQQEQMPQSQWTGNRQQAQPPYIQNNYLPSNRASQHAYPPHPQQIYQQLQQNMAHQQQMQQRAINGQMQMMNSQQQQQQVQGNQATLNFNEQQFRGHIPQQGMSSPQEGAMNRMKNPQIPLQHNYPTVHQRDFEYTMNRENGWPRSNSATILRPNVPTSQPFNLQNQQQQFASAYRQQQPAYQHQQLYRKPAHGTTINQDQQNQLGFHRSTNNQQMPMPQQTGNHSTIGQNDKRKPLQFTVAMLRDQEKLVATMKQQGVPLDIMKRQFDSLINEQRRQLEYVEQLYKQDQAAEAMRPQPVIRRRKQVDEKPEWMIHLTPPRLSYSELERLYEERKQREHQAQELQQVEQAQQLPQSRPHEMSNQHISLPANQQQHPTSWQQPAAWPQRYGTPQYRNTAYPQSTAIPNSANVNPQFAKQVPSAPAVNYQYYQEQQNASLYRYPQYPYQQQQQRQQVSNETQYQQCQQISQENWQQNQGRYPVQQNQQDQQNQQNRPLTEPSSLLKMRLYKQVIRPQRRNNGLQDPEEARKQLREFESSMEARKGLEYLANFAPKKTPVKLNGVQERNEIENDWRDRHITGNYRSAEKRPPASNGLENQRNLDNPPPRRLTNIKMQQELLREYPRQKHYTSANCCNVQAERENGTVATEQQVPVGQNSSGVIPYNEKNPLTARVNVMPYRFEGTYPQHYQQMQQYYQNAWNITKRGGEGGEGRQGGQGGQGDAGSAERQNAQTKGNFDRAGGDASANMNIPTNGQLPENKMTFHGMHLSQPDIHEARTIGGVRYLARKQNYIPNTQFLPPETLIAGRHLQPPMLMY